MRINKSKLMSVLKSLNISSVKVYAYLDGSVIARQHVVIAGLNNYPLPYPGEHFIEVDVAQNLDECFTYQLPVYEPGYSTPVAYAIAGTTLAEMINKTLVLSGYPDSREFDPLPSEEFDDLPF